MLLVCVLGLLLEMLPLPLNLHWFRLPVLFSLIAYITLVYPNMLNFSMVFALGIFIDLLSGRVLGASSAALLLLFYLTNKFRLRIRFSPLVQQTLVMASFLLCAEIVRCLFLSFSAKIPSDFILWFVRFLLAAGLWLMASRLLPDWRQLRA